MHSPLLALCAALALLGPPARALLLSATLPRSLAAPASAAASVAAEAPASTFSTFAKDMHTPCPIPAAGIAAATALMESGRLYRYNSPSPAECPVCEVEERLKAYTGHRHCLALNSCGSALYLSLLTAGAKPGDKVATNAFTFGAVPSAIWHAGGEPVYLETADNYVVCPDTLEAALAREESKGEPVRFLMLSHMRGKIADLPRVAAICKARGVVLLEDCAHSLGVTFDGEHTGHRALSCGVSSQAYKMLNSGEGGFLLTNDAEVYAKAMVYAGCYENLMSKHRDAPPQSVFDKIDVLSIPNLSLRMHGVTAACITPQIDTLDARIKRYNERYARVEKAIRAMDGVRSVPVQLPQVGIVGDSIQFDVLGGANGLRNVEEADRFLELAKERGVTMGRFGHPSNARNFRNWQYARVPAEEELPRTAKVIRGAIDLRLPLQFEDADFDVILQVIRECLSEVKNR